MSGERGERYAHAALESEAGKLQATGDGGRNSQAFRSGAAMGELVAAGALPEAVAEAALTEAATAAGLPRREGATAVRNGLRAGKRKPREIPEGERPSRRPSQYQPAPKPPAVVIPAPPRARSDIHGWRLHGARCRSVFDRNGSAYTPSWGEMLADLRAAVPLPGKPGQEIDDRKKLLGAWFHGVTTGENPYDTSEASSVREVSAVVLDFDADAAKPVPGRGEPGLNPGRLRELLTATLGEGCAWVAHTSVKSAPDCWRWRVVIPLAQPVPGADYPTLVNALRLRFMRSSGPLAVEADLSANCAEKPRLWYVPALHPEHPGHATVEHYDGEPLDGQAFLAAAGAAAAVDGKPLSGEALATRLRNDANAERARLIEVRKAADAERAALLDCKVGMFLDDALTRMERRHAKLERPIPIPFQSMADALGGGLWSGMYVLVGNTGSGKSQLSLQLAVEAARAGTPVLYIGLELGRVDLTARLIGLLTPVPWSYLYLGKSVQTPDLRTKHAAELDELRRLPFHLELGGPFGWSYADLEPRVRAMRDLYPEPNGPGSRPMLVVLDFLQLVSSSEGEREELRERIGRAAYVGRKVARDYDAAVVLVSSTARDNYARLDASIPGEKGKPLAEPPLAALVGLGKESGEVEYAADAVLALRREADGMRLAVAKGRAVKPCWVELRFDGTRFSEPKPKGRVDL